MEYNSEYKQFQGRYQAILVDADSYLLQLIRYVHLNPVRSGLVADPAAYPHSSHRGYLGQADVPWLHRDWVLGQFANTEAAARQRYRRFIEAGLAEGHRADLYRGGPDSRILGDDRFAESVERQGRKALRRPIPIERILAAGADVVGIDPDRLCSVSRDRGSARARALLAYVVVTDGQSTLTALSRIVHRDVATLSNAASLVRDRMSEFEKAGLAPPVDIAIVSGPLLTTEGAMKVHSFGTSTTLTRDVASRATLLFTDGISVAAITRKLPVRSPFPYVREICRIVFFSFSLTSLGVRAGLLTVTAAPALISVRIFLSAMAPPPTTTTFFPEILRKAG